MSSTAGSYAEFRLEMVERQLRGRGIRCPRVLAAMGRIPREQFVLPPDRDAAYEDRPLPIGHGATISQPYIVALMTEALNLRPQDRVLEIGTGSGYQTAILAQLAGEVLTVEIVPELLERASARLAERIPGTVRMRSGDGRAGWPELAPFDAILLTAAPRHLPAALLDQLAPGGRLVAPVGQLEQRLSLWERNGDRFSESHLAWVRFVPLQGSDSEET